MGTKQVLIFVHMPKAGGSTLQEIMRRQFPQTATFNIAGESVETVQASVDRLRQMPEAERAQIACVMGHVPFGLHQWLPGAPRYLTMLRDPVERTISDYFFALNTPGHVLFERMRRGRLSIEDFVALREEQGYRNMYCRLLSGVAAWDQLADTPRALPSAALGAAQENLKRHFSLVGITERFDESLVLAQTALGWKRLSYERANVTHDKPEQTVLTEKALDAIHRHNQMDICLYEFALRLMDVRTAAEEGFTGRVRRFKKRNSRYQRWRILRRTMIEQIPTPMRRAYRALGRGAPR